MTILNGKTNTDRIIKKAVKRLFLLETLKKYGASETDMKRFYASVIRLVLEYGAQVWHGGVTKSQSNNIGKIHKRALRIIYSEKDLWQITTDGRVKVAIWATVWYVYWINTADVSNRS